MHTTEALADRSPPWTKLLLLFALIALPLGLWRLGSTDIISMEGIVADGARYMDHNGHYWVPRLHGEIYSYKPPLAYWLALASTHLFGGESEWSLRLPFAASGIAMALVIFGVIGARLGRRVGLICGLASISGILVIQKLRMAEFDMPLAAGVGAATALTIVELTTQQTKVWRWQAAYACLVFAFLAKGVPALMFFAPGLLLAAWLTDSWRRLFTPAHLLGAATFALGVGGWIVAAGMSEGWAAFTQPAAEASVKGMSWTAEALASTLAKPLSMFASFFPWTLILPLAFSRTCWSSLDPEARATAKAAAGFVVGGLLTLMAVPATETRYLLPLAGPLGILCGILLQCDPGRLWQRATQALTLLIGLVLTLGGPALALTDRLDVPAFDLVLLVAGGAVAIATTLLARRRRWPAPRGSLAMVSAIALCLWLYQVLINAPHREESRTLRAVADLFEPHVPDDEPLWVAAVSAEYKHSSLPYYLERQLTTFDDSRIPPVGARALMFSDEYPLLEGDVPFTYRVIEQQPNRHIDFLLVQVTQENLPVTR